MPHCHFLLIVTVVAVMFIYKDTKMSKVGPSPSKKIALFASLKAL